MNHRTSPPGRPGRTLSGLLLFVLLLLAACRPEPTAEDLVRVKEQFLVMRFRAPFVPEYAGMNDRELFEESCKNNRVNCEVVLERLKQEDPAFYRTLVQ